MARQVNQALWDQWRQRLERQRESGLSITDFCRRENLSRQGFQVWKRKLRQAAFRREGPRPAAAAQRLRKRRGVVSQRRAACGQASSAMPPCSTGFLQLPLAATRPSPWNELALADGTVIRLPQQNVAALVAVLRVLRGDPSGVTSGERGDV